MSPFTSQEDNGQKEELAKSSGRLRSCDDWCLHLILREAKHSRGVVGRCPSQRLVWNIHIRKIPSMCFGESMGAQKIWTGRCEAMEWSDSWHGKASLLLEVLSLPWLELSHLIAFMPVQGMAFLVAHRIQLKMLMIFVRMQTCLWIN